MKELEQQQKAIRQFLLGELEVERRQSFEERFMTDREYRDEVLMVEGELLDDYVNGALSEGDQAKFLDHYLSAPRQEQKLRTVQALSKVARSSEPVRLRKSNWFESLLGLFKSSNRPLQFASASLVIVGLVGVVLVFQYWRARTNERNLREELARLNTPESLAQANGSVLPVTLPALNLRDESSLPKISLTPATNIVQLKAPIAGAAYQAYRVNLRTLEGAQVVEFDIGTEPRDGILPIQLPSHILKPNDYTFTIQGLKTSGTAEDLGDYSFRVLSYN